MSRNEIEDRDEQEPLAGIAIVGLAGRFPGARDAAALWRNLSDGVEAITPVSEADLAASGLPAETWRHPDYVRASPCLEGIDQFDARFFGFSPREAALLDPQHRLFLECAWEAFADAGYDPHGFPGAVGVFAGCQFNQYLLWNVLPGAAALHPAEIGMLRQLSDKDYLATRTSYLFNLRGPSITVQTACSTSLVAIHLAARSLLHYECDMALAGGVCLAVPHRAGYLYQRGSILSPDGHCRAFDAAAAGTVMGSGAGVLVLKRLEDAVADGDTVRAVIQGSGVNNDGANKVGYTAPSVDAQAEAIATAHDFAGFHPETVSYIEAHGTGTPMGDPIEIAALTQVFRRGTARRGFCAVGSLKTNVGHLEAAAGVAGVIKTVLALEHELIPASLNCRVPNPEIDWQGSPFFVNVEPRPWPRGTTPRRAGISSFGVGGTNAHVALEEAPPRLPGSPSRPWQLLLLSSRTPAALETATADLARHLAEPPERSARAETTLADAAYTLQVGRRAFAHRRMLVARDATDAAAALAGLDPRRVLSRREQRADRPVAFLFPGQGAQYPDMGRGLYESEPAFRTELDRCCDLLAPHLGLDLRTVIFPPAGADPADAARRLAETAHAQPALFAVEYALARLWMEWGIAPAALLGHSIGEYVAACLAGVFTLPEALALVAARGRLMQRLPAGAMLNVPLPAAEVLPLLQDLGELGEELALAAVNAPDLTVVSGPAGAVAALEARLTERGVEARRLHTSHAFHSPMMEPALAELTAEVRKVRLQPPQIPYLSNLTGTWIRPEEATDPGYWARHLRSTVRFSDGLAALLGRPDLLLLEVGPGRTLATLVRRHGAGAAERTAVGSLRPPRPPHPPRDEQPDEAFLLTALGRLWLAGVRIDWRGFYARERRLRVALPAHPFERSRHWIDAVPQPRPAGEAHAGARPGDLHEIAAPAAGAPGLGPLAAAHPRPDLDVPYAAPRDAAEHGLAAIWQQMLGIDGVGLHDDFFELGGHSLMATQLVSRVRDRFGREVPLDAFFAAPTVAALAALLGAAAPVAAEPIPRVPRGGPLPLSFAQQRLWFLARLEAGAGYTMPLALRARGPLAPAVLARALAEIARRHEVLRTTFQVAPAAGTSTLESLEPAQVIAPPGMCPLPVVDLSDLPSPAHEARRLARQEARRPFDLALGPLWRAHLLRLGPGDQALLLTLHHIVADGWSFGVLVRELAALYGAFAHGAPTPLPELPVQYADFAAWQRRELSGPALAALLAWWRERLAGSLPVLELPLDRPRPPLQTFRGAKMPVAFPPALAGEIRALARARGATPFTVLLAGFQTLLHRATGQRDLLVGTPVAGRHRSELEGLIGLFANTLVLRGDLSGDPSFGELVDRLREVAAGAWAHQDLPFERLVEELNPRRDLARSPLFQVMISLDNSLGVLPAVSAAGPAGLDLSALEVDAGASRYEWTLFLHEAGDGLAGALEYNTDLFDGATARRALEHLANLLAAAAGDPAAPLSRLRQLSGAEERQLLAEWNETARDFPRDRTVGELIAAQAGRRPDAVAVVFEDACLTGGELKRRAGRLAAELRALGVGAGSLVGVRLERSLDLPAALLAVWQAGGAYLPLDPSYPRERLAYMLEDSGARVVIGEEGPRLSPGAVVDGGTAALPAVSSSGDLAYVIYTSGSTGRPKGVAVPHRALANFLISMSERPGLAAGDRLLAVTSLSFDIAGLELWLPLLVGAQVEVASRALAADGPRLLARLGAGTTVLQATPSTWRLLLEAGWEGGEGLRALCGGEALPWPLARQIARRAGALWNVYGPTETTIWSAVRKVEPHQTGSGSVAIGRPIANTFLYVLDAGSSPAPVGVPGELLIGGEGLARGYLGRPQLTAERFVPDPFAGLPGARLYRTGDLARRLADGEVEFLGRLDHQVKVRGYRIEPGEIEAVLADHPGVRAAVVMPHSEASGDVRLVAWVVPGGEAPARPALDIADLRRHLRARLPEPMVPSDFVLLDELPLLPNGKVDRKALPAPERARPERNPEPAAAPPRTNLERTIAAIWREVLGREQVGIDDNFFDLGGHSLLLAQVHQKLLRTLPAELAAGLAMVDLFQHPTVATLARRLRPGAEPDLAAPDGSRRAEIRRASDRSATDVAIVGMAVRFPGAATIGAFWRNLRGGVESISRFTDEELLASGLDPAVFRSPQYVNAKGIPDGAELFDAGFFGYTPREAEIIDPQQRLFLEVAWEALEDAGCDPDRHPGLIGVFAGSGVNTYLFNLFSHPELVEAIGGFQATISNDKDFLPTRVSYKLNLKGPSLNVQTACSTSLVAVHVACQHLLHGECDLALAGGSTLYVPLRTGTRYQEGGILSPDGHCRAFDELAQGTVIGNGAAAVVLKRLADALADGDAVYAVVKGSAINNDGSVKVSYTAPSVEGQSAVIAQALAIAGISADTVRYVETHGTGTALGDPIEIRALTRAFRAHTDQKGFCAIGSVKSNIGHLDTAAGVAGLIKATLAVERGEIPPSLHFVRPNPALELPETPFFVASGLTPWPADGLPRRAGVSAFGIGGTNAHALLEEAPAAAREPSGPGRAAQLLALSARSESALEAATDALVRHLREVPAAPLADVAFTLHVGRKVFAHRRTVVAADAADAAAALAARDPKRVLTHHQERADRPVFFLFPGGGAQYPGMAFDLYRSEPVFRTELNLCLQLLGPYLGHLARDPRRFLFPAPGERDEAARQLERPAVALPLLFTVEWALAKLLAAWGLRPRALLGHSLGEYTAACLAGVLSLEDALALVTLRGRLFEKLPAGAMLAVPLPEAEVTALLAESGCRLSIAAVNGPAFSVASGAVEAIAAAQALFAGRGIDARRIHIAVAAHSAEVEPILGEFGDFVATLDLKPPKLPYASNVTGTWITADQATDPGYWVRHLRQTVRFGDGVSALAALEEEGIFLEVGPGQTLATLVQQHPDRPAGPAALTTLRHPQDPQSDTGFLLGAWGKLWLAGARVDQAGFYAGQRRRKVRLPTYPFERRRYWVERKRETWTEARQRSALVRRPEPADWLYAPAWRQTPLAIRLDELPDGAESAAGPWLVLLDRHGLGARLATELAVRGAPVATAAPGAAFARTGEAAWTLRPGAREDFEALMRDLAASSLLPRRIVHLWNVGEPAASDRIEARIEAQVEAPAEDLAFYSLLFLAQAIGELGPAGPVRVDVVSSHLQAVTGEERLVAERALALGPVRVLPQEIPAFACRSIDVDLPAPESQRGREQVRRLLAELLDPADPDEWAVAYRGSRRWTQSFEPLRRSAAPPQLRRRGVYLITGGLGGLGLALAEHLARSVEARLVLTGRSPFPARDAWDGWLERHPAEDDPIGRKIRRLRALEELGAEVLVASADVRSRDEMRTVVDLAHRRFGPIHGALHAAGVAGGGLAQLRSRDAAAAVLSPRVAGARVLAEVLTDEPLEVFVCCSAVSAILGGVGRIDLCAANSFLDTFAAQLADERGLRAVAIGWDTWREVGMAATAVLPADLAAFHRDALQHGIATAEGSEVFDRALASGLPRVVVSTRDLPALLARARAAASGAGTAGTAGEDAALAAAAPAGARPLLGTSWVAPAGEAERAVATVWEELLGIAGIGAHDNFFELGGHSLTATRIVGRLRNAFAVELPLARFFEAPTIAGLAAVLSAERSGASGPAPRAWLAGAIPALPRDGRAFPLSYAQQRLWFLDQLEAGSSWYNMPIPLRLSGRLDVAALAAALAAVVRRHEALRTTFVVAEEGRGGRAVQVVGPLRSQPLPAVDLTLLPPAARQAELRRLLAAAARLPFDLAAGPLLRAVLFTLEDSEHALLLNMHHIVSDGWSLGVLVRDVAAFYEAFSHRREPSLAPLPLQYADFAAWQRQALSGPALDALLGYWRRQLAGLPPLVELPTDRPRPALQTLRGSTRPAALPAGATTAVQALARQEGTTPFVVLLAAFLALLHRSTGQPDLVVGSPIANRNRPELEDLIGFFVNTLVLRVDLGGDPTFRELLGRVRAVAEGAYAHQDLPFEKLVEELEPERQLAHNPLFQILFVLQNAPVPEHSLPGLTLAPVPMRGTTAKFDLSLYVREGREDRAGEAELAGFFEFNTDLFDPPTIARLADHFARLLASAVAAPEQRIWELPLLGAAERLRLLVEANDTGPSFRIPPGCTRLHHLFEARAALAPEAVALVEGDRYLTYGELDRWANRWAHWLADRLRARGAGPEALVGIAMRRSADLVLAILATAKAGAAWVPLDPDYPDQRLTFVLEDTGAPVLLVDLDGAGSVGGIAGAPQSGGALRLCPAAERGAIAARPADPPAVSGPAGLAYVIYTSGSTGRPKGVAIEHRSALAFLHWAREVFPPRDLAGVLFSTSICFDLSIFELFAPLSWGGTVLLAEDALALADLPAAAAVTLINTVPSAIAELARLGALPRSVRTVNLAGEPLPRALVERLYAEPGVERVFDLYGPSEDTTYSTCGLAARGGAGEPAIGRPVAGTRVYLLDRRLEPVPLGVPGELFLGGDGLARGYLNRPALTAERFVPDPFGDPSRGGGGGRLYRTGDLARWLPSGDLAFLGRIDHQVKVRGFRIELGEIESALRAHPAVAEAVVTAGAGPDGAPRLEAYVVQGQFAGAGEDVAAWQAEHVAQWRALYDDTYRGADGADLVDPTFNIAGWNSSYTGEPIPADEMRAWVDATVERILALAGRTAASAAPRILEIGCGTGLLLFRLAPHASRYVGHDFSAAAVEYVEAQLAALAGAGRGLPQAAVARRTADDCEDLAPGSFDLVILNSVVQYFPDADYLRRVLAGVVRAVAPGGAIFVGDARSQPLLPALAASIELHQAPASLPVTELAQRVRRRIQTEEELVVAPAFFAALAEFTPELAGAEVHLKRGRHDNELVRFRYDAVLWRAGEGVRTAAEPAAARRLGWSERGLTCEAVRRLLADERPASLVLRSVPNARVLAAVRAAELLAEPAGVVTAGELVALAGEAAGRGVEPEDLRELGRELGYEVDVRWSDSGPEGRYDVVLCRPGAEEQSAAERPSEPSERRRSVHRPWSSYANHPLQGQFARRLVPHLRSFLAERLPEHMVPSVFVLLEALPLTPNGKVDRKALVPPDSERPRLGAPWVAPRTAGEEALAAVWSEVLGVDPIGVHDNFFELGGHSLLAVRLFARIRARFGRGLPLTAIFRAPTIALLAALLDGEGSGSAPAAQGGPSATLQSNGPSASLQADGLSATLQADGPLAVLRAGGTLRPLVCIHPVGGSVFCYTALVQALGPDQPVYGLQCPEEGAPPASLEEMAARYLAALRAVQPEGPYRLCGWSMGGLVAFEMARQLAGRGEGVAQLAVLDVAAPDGAAAPVEVDEATARAWFARDVSRGLAAPEEGATALADLPADWPLDQVFEEARRRGLLPSDLDFAAAVRRYQIFKANLGLTGNYVPQPYAGRIQLFSAAASHFRREADPTLGWAGLAAGGVDLHPLPGDHWSVVQPPAVAAVAAALHQTATPALASPPPRTASPDSSGDDVEAVHRGLSEVDWRFRERARQDQECLSRSTFRAFEQRAGLLRYRPQPWPLFVDRSRLAELERVSIGLSRLIRGIPGRIFGGDPAQIGRTFDLDEALVELVLAPPTGIERALSRGDFVQTRAGFQCLEFNMGSNLGGWESGILAGMLSQVPPIHRFLESLDRPVDFSNTLHLLFQHVVREAVAAGQAAGEIHTLIGMREERAVAFDPQVLRFLTHEYGAALAEIGRAGTIGVTIYDDLAERGGALHHQGRRIHALVEMHNPPTDPTVLRCSKLGTLHLYNGPPNLLLSDKRNLALLSERQDSDLFTPAEQALLREHLPWTRRALPGEVSYQGRTVVLGELLLAEQERMVLKKAASLGGAHVVIGRFTPRDRWRAVLEEALAAGDWIVQEYAESVPYLFQAGEQGCCPHDAVWGPFVFGETAAGTILRVQPKSLGGVVNLSREATEAMLYEVADGKRPAG